MSYNAENQSLNETSNHDDEIIIDSKTKDNFALIINYKVNECEVDEKLKSLGLNDTYENKTSKSMLIDDSIECLNDSSVFPKAEIVLDETPDSEISKKYKTFSNVLNSKNEYKVSPLATNDLKRSGHIISDTPEAANEFSNSELERIKYINKVNDSLEENWKDQSNYKTHDSLVKVSWLKLPISRQSTIFLLG